jgi:hypothetical protein
VPIRTVVIPVPSNASMGMKALSATCTIEGGVGVVVGVLPPCPIGTRIASLGSFEMMPMGCERAAAVAAVPARAAGARARRPASRGTPGRGQPQPRAWW